MLAKAADVAPDGAGWLFEPKWDGFRAHRLPRRRRGLHPEPRPQARSIATSRSWPRRSARRCRSGCVVDGEIVIAGADGPRLRGAAPADPPGGVARRDARRRSRRRRSSRGTCWRSATSDLRDERQAPGERALETALAERHAAGPPHARHRATGHRRRTGSSGSRAPGLDGVVAKPRRRRRTSRASARCSRSSTSAPPTASWPASAGTRPARAIVGSLLLGLYDDAGTLHHVGVTLVLHDGAAHARWRPSSRRCARTPWRATPGRDWADWAAELVASGQRVPGATSRWNRGRDLSWEPLRVERVCEVAYDHLQGARFRHGTTFLRWRPDKRPENCRYDQLETTAPFELERIFGAQRGA